jgi:hypothetical protein
MATRMQQRRGTAAQWTAANPILAAGEIGFETDTSKFKMGNGSSAWSALTYFANAAELAAIIDGAPAALNTLNELAEAMGDNPAFLTTIASELNTHSTDTTNIHGIADTSALATTANTATAISTAVSTHQSDTTSVHGIADTAALALTADVATTVSTAVSNHNADTTDVHGISNTANLATQTYVTDAIAGVTGDYTLLGGVGITWNTDTEQFDVDNTIATASSLTAHSDDTTNIHGIADTAALATTAATASAIESAITTHTADTTAVHGIADTAALATTAATASAISTAVSDHNTDTTNVHGIANTALLATTADVAAVTKTSLGLGNVDNTADASKPVSTAQSTAIATAKAEAIADATSQVNALLTGAPAALNTLDELAAALGDDANFASSVTTSLGLKVDSLTPISQKTASYTLSSLTERDDLIEMGSASALVLTIPTDATLDFPIGTSIDILQTGAGQVTIAPVSGTVTVNATPGLKLRTTWSSCTLFKRAANTWVVYGDLTA